MIETIPAFFQSLQFFNEKYASMWALHQIPQ